MPEVASQTFDLVGREVNATLAEARGALETYVEQPDNVQLLERCAQDLHQVQGVLRLLEIYGNALLSEGTLLLLNLKSDQQAQPQAAAAGEPPMTVDNWARRLRARYQVGLIGWIRGERVEQNLEILGAVARKLEQIATRQPVFQLWWVIGAVIEALREKGLESGQSVKRLLGLGDREIRRLYEQGEARYAQSPPVELLNNLLYYIGRSESSGPRVSAVRVSFRLSELLPVDEGIEQERENLSAPSVKLMQTVAAAIREDLAKVKDVLDIFVRRGAGQPQELGAQVDMLRKIGDTLGVLGLGELRANVQRETERLQQIVAGTLKADEATLVEIAATLIGVEDKLDSQLVGMILPRDAELPRPAEDGEFQQVQAAVLRECIVNLARIKEAVTQSVGGTLDAAGLDSWQDLMRGMKAGLLLLGKARAVEVIEAITGQLRRVMQPGIHVLPPGFVDRLADAIVSLEYYMETVQAGRSDPWYMLDNAQACVQAHEPLPDMVAGGASAPTLAPSSSAKVAAPVEHADPELLNLFIEEAHEELARIRHCFPAWDHNPLERDALVTVRRSFHTLKGSGRMVGARELSEFAWAIENLINRVLDNTLSRSPTILETLRAAVSALPELITQLQTREPVRTDVNAIASRAHALAAGRQTPARSTPEHGEEEAAEPPPMPAMTAAALAAEAASRQTVPDDTLRDIYARETAAHVATVRGYLARESQLPEPHALPEDVYRACHTLSGSSKMAQARHGIRLAEPLDHWLRRAYSSGLGLGSEDLALLADCMAAMESVATHLDEPTGYFVNHWQLLERIERADKGLDQRIAAAGAHTGIHAAIGAAAAPGQDAQATELIDAAERALSEWRSQPNSADSRASLKRPLHTLKGGARMAGITPMGDLSHELETLVMSVDNGEVTAGVAVFDVIQASLDELARMREQVINGRPVAAARAIITRLQSLSRAAPPTAPAKATPPEARRAPPVPAPAAAAAPAAGPEPSGADTDTMLARLNAELLSTGDDHTEPADVEPVSDAPGPPPAPATAPAPSFAAPALPLEAGWTGRGTLPGAWPLTRARAPEPHTEEGLSPPQPVPPGREPVTGGERQEMARVDADLLDQLLNISGEASIARARLEQQLGSFDFNLGELSRTVTRLKE